MKPLLMIHEVREWMFDLPLNDYILTFDDGLYSQYYYNDRFKQLTTQRIYYVSSGIVSSGLQSQDFPTCVDAHIKARAGNTEDYMTVDQIKELMQDPNVIIGAHSHSHTRLDNFTSLAEKVRYINEDTEQMIQWFEANLGFKPTHFCFPYNEDPHGLYKGLVKKFGITDCVGLGRTPIETLLHKASQPDNLDTLPAWSLPRYS
jgi:peptidoglycan/xylan/chitin deacetylase (PgdA/CDA1 family)